MSVHGGCKFTTPSETTLPHCSSQRLLSWARRLCFKHSSPGVKTLSSLGPPNSIWMMDFVFRKGLTILLKTLWAFFICFPPFNSLSAFTYSRMAVFSLCFHLLVAYSQAENIIAVGHHNKSQKWLNVKRNRCWLHVKRGSSKRWESREIRF